MVQSTHPAISLFDLGVPRSSARKARWALRIGETSHYPSIQKRGVLNLRRHRRRTPGFPMKRATQRNKPGAPGPPSAPNRGDIFRATSTAVEPLSLRHAIEPHHRDSLQPTRRVRGSPSKRTWQPGSQRTRMSLDARARGRPPRQFRRNDLPRRPKIAHPRRVTTNGRQRQYAAPSRRGGSNASIRLRLAPGLPSAMLAPARGWASTT